MTEAEYVWGMFVDGLGMFGSHSGKMSYSLPSGVKP